MTKAMNDSRKMIYSRRRSGNFLSKVIKSGYSQLDP